MSTGQQPRDALTPGYKLLWCEIEGVLGKGGFGITYLAHDLNLDKKVAIKEYLPSDMATRDSDQTVIADPGAVEEFENGLMRFIREARTVAKFEHPNIVRVLNVFEQNQTAYMSMAYEEGKDLKTLLAPKRTMEEDELLSLILPILDGLELIHDAGFVHRDIKPGNIMIRKDGTPVLIDFGSAHKIRKSGEQLTALVSPGYTPHEQYTGAAEAQGPWTDIYSLGATLYRAISGLNPIDAVTRSSALLKGNEDPLVPASQVGQDRYSDAMLVAIDHALAFDEQHRPENIDTWRKELLGERETTLTATTARRVQLQLNHRLGDTQELAFEDVRTGEEAALTRQVGLRMPSAVAAAVCAALIVAGVSLLTRPQEDERPAVTAQSNVAASPIDAVLALPEEDDISPSALGASMFDPMSDGTSSPEMIVVPPGSFMVGSQPNEHGRTDNEGPQRRIHLLEPFAISKTEVTVAQFRRFVEDTAYVTDAERAPQRGCRVHDNGWQWRANLNWKNPGYSQNEAHPVVCVSWDDAVAYVNWLSERTGAFYYLPSETQWEYAARSGNATARFWEAKGEAACRYANVSDVTRASDHDLDSSPNNIFVCEDGFTYSAPVGSFGENDYGLVDMLGNVWEWTADCWNQTYSGVPVNGDPRLSGHCENRVYRGGSWGNFPSLVRAAKRGTDPRNFRYYNVGFRIGRLIEAPDKSTLAISRQNELIGQL
ncbi:MAG: bifunctional serine/threonine-protein kinase/formylglycine-generating enzyme family protein [Pseudomonadota bacterium]